MLGPGIMTKYKRQPTILRQYASKQWI